MVLLLNDWFFPSKVKLPSIEEMNVGCELFPLILKAIEPQSKSTTSNAESLSGTPHRLLFVLLALPDIRLIY